MRDSSAATLANQHYASANRGDDACIWAVTFSLPTGVVRSVGAPLLSVSTPGQCHSFDSPHTHFLPQTVPARGLAHVVPVSLKIGLKVARFSHGPQRHPCAASSLSSAIRRSSPCFPLRLCFPSPSTARRELSSSLSVRAEGSRMGEGRGEGGSGAWSSEATPPESNQDTMCSMTPQGSQPLAGGRA